MFKYHIGNYLPMSSGMNLLVFDLGNTLYPSALQFQAMKESMVMHDLTDVNYSELYNHFKHIFPFVGGALDLQFVSAILRNIVPEPEVDAITLLSDYRQNLYVLIKKYIVSDPHGTWKCLRDLSEVHRLGILSDNNIDTKEFWLEILKETCHDFFDFFIVSEEIGVSKPNLRMFFEVKKQLDPAIKFDEIYFFGNHLMRDGVSAFYDVNFIHVSGFVAPSMQKRQPYAPLEPLLSIEYINHDSLLSIYNSNEAILQRENRHVKSLSN